MRINSRSRILLVVTSITSSLSFVLATSSYANTTKEISEVKVAFVGKDLIGYGCWPKDAKGRMPVLQVRVAGQWVTKSKARLYKDEYMCDFSRPWRATYSWRVDEVGEIQSFDSPRAREIFLREFLPRKGKSKAFAKDPYLLLIYRSELDQALDFNDILKGILSGGS